jgi:mono/diheme cytochrome c family protein
VLLISCPAGLASSRDQQEHGASVFAQSGCTYCHSIRKVGGTKGPDLSGVGRRLKVDQMRQQIVEGSKIMPSFKDVLNDSDLADLLAYLHSCRDKKKK